MRLKLIAATICLAGLSALAAAQIPSCKDAGRAQKHPCDSRLAFVDPFGPLPVNSSNANALILRYINPLHFRYSLSAVDVPIAAAAAPAIINPGVGQTGMTPLTATGPTAAPAAAAAAAVAPPRPVGPPAGRPAAPADAAAAAKAAADVAAVDKAFDEIFTRAESAAQQLHSLNDRLNELNVAATNEQQCYLNALASPSFNKPFLKLSEVRALQAFAAANAAPAPALSCRFNGSYDWPVKEFTDIDDAYSVIQRHLDHLMFMPGYDGWLAVPLHVNQNDRLKAIITDSQSAAQSKEAAPASYIAALAVITYWQSMLASIHSADLAKPDPNQQGSPFVFVASVDCSFSWYGKGDVKTATLNITDVTVNPATVTTQSVLTNTCQPSGTVSTGIGLSFVHDRVYAFEPGPDPTNAANSVSTIKTSTDAAVTPLYAVLYNIAAHDSANGLGIHAAIGGAVGSTSGTTNVEFLLGPSFSFRRRAFFITPAFQLARRDQLLPGYSVGTVQNATLTALPVTTNWKPGFGLTFSFGIGSN
jgi:hypothetical protein